MTSLVTVATGKVGVNVVKNLIAVGERPRVYVRDQAKATDLLPDGGFDVAVGDLTDREAMAAAMQGIESVYFAGLDSMGADLTYVENVLSTATEAGVKRVAVVTAFLADVESKSPFVQMMGAIEGMVKASGLDYTFIGPEWFMENFFGYIAKGELNMPFGKGRNSFVSTRDVGAAVAKVLMTDAYNGQKFIATGPADLDHHEVCATVAEVAGAPCVYNALTPDQFREAKSAEGWEDWMITMYIDITSFMRDGMVSKPSGDLEKLLGRAPISLAEWSAHYEAELALLCDPHHTPAAAH